jgi:uncharacterized phage-associated protein
MQSAQSLRNEPRSRIFTNRSEKPQTMNFDREKALNVILYIVQHVKDPGFHKVFKILYFAEQKHLARYGSLIVGDIYVAMQNGPVPSKIYDILKALRQKLAFNVDVSYEQKFINVAGNHSIIPVGHVDLEVFSEAELECINESIGENQALTFGKLTEKSHDEAWKTAQDEDDEMSVEAIAKAGGADTNMLAYIQQVLENHQALKNVSR